MDTFDGSREFHDDVHRRPQENCRIEGRKRLMISGTRKMLRFHPLDIICFNVQARLTCLAAAQS